MVAGLYIHIPFCKAKCRYCGFYSTASDNDVVDNYIDTIINKLKKLPDKNFDTIYVGGGTPSILSEYQLEKLLTEVKSFASGKKCNSNILEFTVEANPDSLTKEKLHIFKNTGVNRISLGIQALDDNVLSLLGRIHDARTAIKALEMVLDFNFFHVNCDVIYDIPTVDFDTSYNTLKILASYPIHHISAYNYSFDTEFLKEYESSDDETAYYDVVDFLESRGFKQYEISNFGRNDFSSKHNIKYWKMEEYIGIGITAHSMVYEDHMRIRTANNGTIKEYIDNAENVEVIKISFNEQIIEDIVFGLRMIEGINLCKLSNHYKYPVDKLIQISYFLTQEGLIEIKKDYLCLTKKGQLFLDYVQQYFWEHFAF